MGELKTTSTMEIKQHWENVYQSKAFNAVSWFQNHASSSLAMIESIKLDHDASIIDIGGGASTLVDDLLNRGFSQMTVLDISGAALQVTKNRLGQAAQDVEWIEADITKASLPTHQYDIWHDRAVFHFLVNSEDRQAYVKQVKQAVKSGGHVIIATFAEDGPTQCSALPVVRYSVERLNTELGRSFQLINHHRESHQTPFETTQQFIYSHFRIID